MSGSYTSHFRTRVITLSSSYLVIIVAPLVLYLAIKASVPDHGTCYQLNGKAWYLCAEARAFLLLTVLATMSGAAVFGSLGTVFSMLSRRPRAALDSPDMLALLLFGSLSAIVLCLLFAGGFLGGTLFPSYQASIEIGWFGVIYSPSNYAKLLVWSFVVGFSERTLTDYVDSLASRIRSSDLAETGQIETKPG